MFSTPKLKPTMHSDTDRQTGHNDDAIMPITDKTMSL